MEALKKYRLVLEEDRKKAEKNGTEYNDHGLVAQTRNGFPVSPYFLEARWLDPVAEVRFAKDQVARPPVHSREFVAQRRNSPESS